MANWFTEKEGEKSRKKERILIRLKATVKWSHNYKNKYENGPFSAPFLQFIVLFILFPLFFCQSFFLQYQLSCSSKNKNLEGFSAKKKNHFIFIFFIWGKVRNYFNWNEFFFIFYYFFNKRARGGNAFEVIVYALSLKLLFFQFEIGKHLGIGSAIRQIRLLSFETN